MVTITRTLYDRLTSQAEEAEKLGFTKLATNLRTQLLFIHDEMVRDDSQLYTYSSDELESDVQYYLWDAAVRVADYLGYNLDGEKVQKLIDKFSEELIQEMSLVAGVKDGVGAYEPTVPGEKRTVVAVDVVDGD